MKQHKWHKEIKAWADGAEIEVSMLCETWHGEWNWSEWTTDTNPEWETVECQYRIKQQPKKPQYLYVYKDYGELCLLEDKIAVPAKEIKYIGKIKLEDNDNGND